MGSVMRQIDTSNRQLTGEWAGTELQLQLGIDLRVIAVSAATAAFANCEAQTLQGQPLSSAQLPEALAQTWTAMAEQCLRQEQAVRCSHSWALDSGALQIFESSAQRLPGADQILIQSQNLTSHAHRSATLVRNQARLERALGASGLGLWDWHLPSGRLYFDQRCVELLEYPADYVLTSIDALQGITHPDDVTRSVQTIAAHLKGEMPYYDLEWRGRTGAGNYKWVCSTGQVTEVDANQQPLRVTGTLRDIDEQKRTAAELDDATAQIRLLLDATDEGMIGLDAEGVCNFANPAALRILGATTEQIQGQVFAAVIQHSDRLQRSIAWQHSPLQQCIRSGSPYRGQDESFRYADQPEVVVDYSVSPLLHEGRPNGVVLAFRDVSERRLMAQEMERQSLLDPLTGLCNRLGFSQRLRGLVSSAHQWDREHALLLLDLDHFKVVNDACGQQGGDKLLQKVAELLQQPVRARDTVARLSGDEFAILLEDCPMATAERIAGEIRDLIQALRFEWEGRSFSVGISTGITAITERSQDITNIVSAADTACRLAKEQGQNRIQVTRATDMAVAQRRGELAWVARIKQALENNRFRLYYQSIVDAVTPDTPPTSHEVLLRLLDEQGKIISPAEFIPAAERFHLMPAVDRWVVENLLRQLGVALKRNPAIRDHHFGINLSGETLRDTELLTITRRALEQHQVPPQMIYFEVTETSAIANMAVAKDFMHGVKALGCELALDDFGSGMSSFSYLKSLPVDYLKIDGSFVRDVLNNPVDREIVEAINAVARRMGIRTIAEFVETREICDCLRQMGVQFAQGYAFAKPTPLSQFAGSDAFSAAC